MSLKSMRRCKKKRSMTKEKVTMQKKVRTKVCINKMERRNTSKMEKEKGNKNIRIKNNMSSSKNLRRQSNPNINLLVISQKRPLEKDKLIMNHQITTLLFPSLLNLEPTISLLNIKSVRTQINKSK